MQEVVPTKSKNNKLPEVLLVTRDSILSEHLAASAAAMQVEIIIRSDPNEVQRIWRGASVVFIGADLAAMVLSLGLNKKQNTYLIGFNEYELLTWSAPLKAAVLVLPQASNDLATILAMPNLDSARARIFQLIGVSGGLGVSTFAATLATLSAKRGLATSIVELNLRGGGLDLIFGVETQTGWRWDKIAGAKGRIGNLAEHLLKSDQVKIVSMGRSPTALSPGAISAVINSLSSCDQVLFLDGGENNYSDAEIILLVGADVYSISAAQAVISQLGLSEFRLVIRQGKGRSISAKAIVDVLGGELLGVLRHYPKIPLLLEAGRPPGSLPFGKFISAAKGMLGRLLDDEK